MKIRPEGSWPPGPSHSQKYRAQAALALLFGVGLINYLDRFAFSVLQVPIKVDLHLSDSQLGLLTGIALFIPFVLLSAPAGRLADRTNRKILLTVALIVWSSMTALISVCDRRLE